MRPTVEQEESCRFEYNYHRLDRLLNTHAPTKKQWLLRLAMRYEERTLVKKTRGNEKETQNRENEGKQS